MRLVMVLLVLVLVLLLLLLRLLLVWLLSLTFGALVRWVLHVAVCRYVCADRDVYGYRSLVINHCISVASMRGVQRVLELSRVRWRSSGVVAT